MHLLQQKIEKLFALGAKAAEDPTARSVVSDFLAALSAGTIRSAQKSATGWTTNAWVKQGILLAFRVGELKESGDPSGLSFVDRDTLPPRHFTTGDKVRVVPGGSAVRVGAYVAPSVI